MRSTQLPLDTVDLIVDFLPPEMFTIKDTWHIYTIGHMRRLAFLSGTVKYLTIHIPIDQPRLLALIPDSILFVKFQRAAKSYQYLSRCVTTVSIACGTQTLTTLPVTVSFLHIHSFRNSCVSFSRGIRVLFYSGENHKYLPTIPSFLRFLIFATTSPINLTRLISQIPSTIEKVLVHSLIRRFQYLQIRKNKIFKLSSIPQNLTPSFLSKLKECIGLPLL